MVFFVTCCEILNFSRRVSAINNAPTGFGILFSSFLQISIHKLNIFFIELVDIQVIYFLNYPDSWKPNCKNQSNRIVI